jgi:hypothetical protein
MATVNYNGNVLLQHGILGRFFPHTEEAIRAVMLHYRIDPIFMIVTVADVRPVEQVVVVQPHPFTFFGHGMLLPEGNTVIQCLRNHMMAMQVGTTTPTDPSTLDGPMDVESVRDPSDVVTDTGVSDHLGETTEGAQSDASGPSSSRRAATSATSSSHAPIGPRGTPGPPPATEGLPPPRAILRRFDHDTTRNSPY